MIGQDKFKDFFTLKITATISKGQTMLVLKMNLSTMPLTVCRHHIPTPDWACFSGTMAQGCDMSLGSAQSSYPGRMCTCGYMLDIHLHVRAPPSQGPYGNVR